MINKNNKKSSTEKKMIIKLLFYILLMINSKINLEKRINYYYISMLLTLLSIRYSRT